ncbi:glutaminyl-tRNA synthetase [Nematocida sp. AWRm77]|nr:glutaminyl-tRNA synthetase [Nematocida sp. AWRm77]
MTEGEKECPGIESLRSLGASAAKAKELYKNKRIRATLPAAEEVLRREGGVTEGQRKLLYKAIETADGKEEAEKYCVLIMDGSAQNETDLRNIESILSRRKSVSAEEVRVQMKSNVPSSDEMVEVATSIVEEFAGEPKARVLKELKHHPRLQFIPPKTILTLLDNLSIDPAGRKREEKRGTLAEKKEELLGLALSAHPPTRTINKMYVNTVVPEEYLKSSERKWTRYLEGEMQTMHTPFTNYQKTAGLLRGHIGRTGGQVRVRFPPEPNGHLHVGHAKALSINFGFKEFFNGWISLRYDDTNPKAEKTEYYEKILEMVEWMGFRPDAITHASDYFGRLHECAVELIKRGKAYVCHLSRADVSDNRKEAMKGKLGSAAEERQISPWRNRSVEENLAEFEKMTRGEYEEGAAVLRMKMDMNSDNPQLWDLVAYRVVKHAHPRTGTAWVVYPSYDFTHCLTDSFEDITHSFCTTEFINSRESYNWLCDALDVYRPVQWEYSRLNITGSLLSKRFITRSIKEGKFTGWDDPRLSTLEGLRSRGVPPGSIRRFVESLGITTANSEIPKHVLESIIREDLMASSKAAVVFEPLTLKIVSPGEGCPETVLIDRRDYRRGEYNEAFFQIQKGGAVLLKGIGPVEFVREEEGTGVVFVQATNKAHSSAIPWVGAEEPAVTLEVVEGEEILQYANARVSPEALKSPPGVYWQFIRAGFFVRIETPKEAPPLFRMVVPLKAASLLSRGEQ